jgi:protein-tyrosine phosphatase
VRSGSCCVPSPDTPDEHLDDTVLEAMSQSTAVSVIRPRLPDEARQYKSDAFGPRNFLWLRKGVLAGTPRPGLLIELDYDLAALQRVGVTVLVSLTTRPIAPDALANYGIHGIAFPIKDMGVPTIDKAMALCAQIAAHIKQGDAVALHCKAGMGRTGAMLAAQLIWEGKTALDALETARRIEPRWVQSEEQVNFLDKFALALANTSHGRQVASS